MRLIKAIDGEGGGEHTASELFDLCRAAGEGGDDRWCRRFAAFFRLFVACEVSRERGYCTKAAIALFSFLGKRRSLDDLIVAFAPLPPMAASTASLWLAIERDTTDYSTDRHLRGRGDGDGLNRDDAGYGEFDLTYLGDFYAGRAMATLVDFAKAIRRLAQQRFRVSLPGGLGFAY